MGGFVISRAKLCFSAFFVFLVLSYLHCRSHGSMLTTHMYAGCGHSLQLGSRKPFPLSDWTDKKLLAITQNKLELLQDLCFELQSYILNGFCESNSAAQQPLEIHSGKYEEKEMHQRNSTHRSGGKW